MSGLICKMADQKEDLKGHMSAVNKVKLFPALQVIYKFHKTRTVILPFPTVLIFSKLFMLC